ncbi:MAG: response regulator [Candidatus Paceibacterota bacterium]|jgi:two-component system phosphate regulon response regulator PhoB/two-component system alkaline phosphatase synthesis response regulator PhoP
MAKKVFIVEDDEFLRSLTVKRLEKEGYGVAVSPDGEGAMDGILKEKPDIILLDLLLPGLNGYEVLQKIRDNDSTKALPVIVFSNLGQREDIEKAKAIGVSDFLIKANFTLDDVVIKVENLLK